MRVTNVPITTLSLLHFPFSKSREQPDYGLNKKKPPRSIQTWTILYPNSSTILPPSQNTKFFAMRSTDFQQRFDESVLRAWIRFNEIYLGRSGGNFLDKMPRECLKIIESKSKVRQTRAKAVVAKVSTNSSTQAVSSDVAELKDIVRCMCS
ncbi:hypothetical protein Tco_0587909 [Tanacetum coccineum]